MSYPQKLQEIVSLFEHLPEEEKRESLVSYSLTTKSCEPADGEKFDLEDVRKDEECADTVGVFLKVDEEGRSHFRMTLGPQVQTLTKAMAAILCKGLEGVKPKEIQELESDFVPKIVGGGRSGGRFGIGPKRTQKRGRKDELPAKVAGDCFSF